MARNPLWTSTLSYDAHTMRVADAMMAMTDGTSRGARQGVRPGPALGVSIAGATLTVGTGNAIVSSAAGEGVYLVEVDTAWTGTINPADATYTRIDLVYLRVWDADLDGTGLHKADIVYLAGTPSGSPVAPSVPAGQYGLVLATVTVPPSGGGAASVNNAVRPYTVGAGGILPVSQSADTAASGAYTGQARYNTVRGALELWGGTAWAAPGDWTAYTPVWSGLSAMGAATASGRWAKIGRTVHMTASLTWGSGCVLGNGNINVSLPTPAASLGTGQGWQGLGRYFAAGDWWRTLVVDCESGATAAAVFIPDSNQAWQNPGVLFTNFNAAGSTLRVELTYEAAS